MNILVLVGLAVILAGGLAIGAAGILTLGAVWDRLGALALGRARRRHPVREGETYAFQEPADPGFRLP